MKTLKSIIFRIVAVFGSSALAAVAGGAMIGVNIAKSAALAGCVSVASVLEKLFHAYIDDGVLTADEINQAFAGNKLPAAAPTQEPSA